MSVYGRQLPLASVLPLESPERAQPANSSHSAPTDRLRQSIS
jgi:hypothetical protein